MEEHLLDEATLEDILKDIKEIEKMDSNTK